MATVVTAGGSGEDLILEQALYRRAAEATSPSFGPVLEQLRGDVAHLMELRARVAAGSPPLDVVGSAAVEAERMTAAEEAAASAAIRRLDDLGDADTLWVLEEVIREALHQEQSFAYLYGSAPEAYAQILQRRQIMLERIRTVTSDLDEPDQAGRRAQPGGGGGTAG